MENKELKEDNDLVERFIKLCEKGEIKLETPFSFQENKEPITIKIGDVNVLSVSSDDIVKFKTHPFFDDIKNIESEKEMKDVEEWFHLKELSPKLFELKLFDNKDGKSIIDKNKKRSILEKIERLLTNEIISLSEKEKEKIKERVTKQMKIENKENDINSVMLKYPHLLLPYDEKNEVKYGFEAVFVAFDFCSFSDGKELFYEFTNRDYLYIPNGDEVNGNYNVNYFQMINVSTDERNPIQSTFSYLFDNSEPYYDEPYDFSEDEKKMRRDFHKHLKNKFTNGANYLKYISEMLFSKSLTNEYDNYISTIDKKFNKIK